VKPGMWTVGTAAMPFCPVGVACPGRPAAPPTAFAWKRAAWAMASWAVWAEEEVAEDDEEEAAWAVGRNSGPALWKYSAKASALRVADMSTSRRSLEGGGGG
jgi:hypothetical protein